MMWQTDLADIAWIENVSQIISKNMSDKKLKL